MPLQWLPSAADEPTGNLDEDTANEIISIFQQLAHEQGKCVIVVTHSKELAEQADVVLRLKKGKIADGIGANGGAAIATVAVEG